IQRAMAREPSERYQSAAEVEAALAQLSASALSLDRRARSLKTGAKAPRVQLVLSVFSLLALLVPSLGLATLALLQSRGIDLATFRPSTLEWLLFTLLALFLLFPLGLLVQRFRKHTWKNSSRVAALLPAFTGALLAGTLAYGVSAFVVLSAWGIQGLRGGNIGGPPPMAALGWFIVLPLNALLGASAVMVAEIARKV